VLVVDDHEMVAKSLVRLLEDPTISIIGAESTGQAGITRALAEHADVVVMDFQLPDMDGAAATRELLRGAAGIKVIGLVNSFLWPSRPDTSWRSAMGLSEPSPKTRDNADGLKALGPARRGPLLTPRLL
jgi:two-component system, NarL family, response regulator LiaR